MVYYSLDVEILLQTSMLPSKPSRWLSEYFSKDECDQVLRFLDIETVQVFLGPGKSSIAKIHCITVF